jgi:hypothetical protein
MRCVAWYIKMRHVGMHLKYAGLYRAHTLQRTYNLALYHSWKTDASIPTSTSLAAIRFSRYSIPYHGLLVCGRAEESPQLHRYMFARCFSVQANAEQSPQVWYNERAAVRHLGAAVYSRRTRARQDCMCGLACQEFSPIWATTRQREKPVLC